MPTFSWVICWYSYRDFIFRNFTLTRRGSKLKPFVCRRVLHPGETKLIFSLSVTLHFPFQLRDNTVMVQQLFVILNIHFHNGEISLSLNIKNYKHPCISLLRTAPIKVTRREVFITMRRRTLTWQDMHVPLQLDRCRKSSESCYNIARKTFYDKNKLCASVQNQ